MSQIDIFDEIIVDNFAGGGGASTGIELAAGRPVAIAINHDPNAILLHKTNHPYTEHLQTSVWDVDPVEVCKGRPVGLAWFSPDCKHFSKAKGAALRDRKIRGLAWIVLRWAGTVRPRVIMLENVEEFQTWGPVRKGKPVKKHAGKTFKQFIKQLEDLCYVVEYRELVAADYGAPTTRKRFALIARCDGKPIVWPQRTHAPRDSEEVRSGKLLPWRGAHEIIDWSLPSYSIFESKQEIKERYGVNAVRPLANNTLRRVIRGVDKFTIKSGNPFIVPMVYGERKGQAPRVHDVDNPLPTVVGKDKHGVCQPVMVPATFSNTGGSVGSCAADPVHTIRTAGGQVLSAANLIQYHTEQSEKVRGQVVGNPIQTLDTSNRYGLASAQLVEYYGNGNPLNVEDPLHTVTTHDREALVCAHLDKYFNGSYMGCGDRAYDPLSTVTVQPRHGLVAVHMAKFRSQELGTSMEDPLPTVTTAGHFAQCQAVLTKVQPGCNLGKWPQIRELLNEHCGYQLMDDEIILLIINGIAYFIADILLRMLTPREQYSAMSFPSDYAIERDYMGNAYPKNEQTAKCGNAVCPVISYAMVKVNFTEWDKGKLETMEQFHNAVAV